MKTTAIICELNPLHRGHKYLFDTVRRDADCVIAIMSGNFVQRSEPALLDKYTRAEIAVKAGADLVVELPFPWCSASAEYFAMAGTAIAEKAGAEKIAFGIGYSDPFVLSQAADFFSDPEVIGEIRRTSGNDPSVGIASVREKCLKSRLGSAFGDVLRTPNDILAIEYLRQIRSRGYRLIPQMIPRLTEISDPQFCGATQIRSLLREEGLDAAAPYLPDFVYPYISESIQSGAYTPADVLPQIAFQAFRTDFAAEAIHIAEGKGGLLERIRTAAQKSTSAEEMIAAAATKKYTNARIRRVLLYYLLRVATDILREIPAVTTLLAASDTGRAYLASVRKNSAIRILTKPADHRALPQPAAKQYQYTLDADALYTLCRHMPVPADFFLKEHPRFC